MADATRSEAQELVEQGADRYHRGDLRGAAELWRRASRLAPGDVRARAYAAWGDSCLTAGAGRSPGPSLQHDPATIEVAAIAPATIEMASVGAATIEVATMGARTLEVAVPGAPTIEVASLGAPTIEVARPPVAPLAPAFGTLAAAPRALAALAAPARGRSRELSSEIELPTAELAVVGRPTIELATREVRRIVPPAREVPDEPGKTLSPIEREPVTLIPGATSESSGLPPGAAPPRRSADAQRAARAAAATPLRRPTPLTSSAAPRRREELAAPPPSGSPPRRPPAAARPANPAAFDPASSRRLQMGAPPPTVESALALLAVARAALDRGDPDTAFTAVERAVSSVGFDAPELISYQSLLGLVYQTQLGDKQRLLQAGSSPRALEPRAAFLLSRVDGTLTIEDVIDVSGMPALEATRLLAVLLRAGALTTRDRR